MTEQEIATVKAHVGILKDIPVVLPNDYTPDPAGLPRKFTSFPIDLPPPPVAASGDEGGPPELQSPITITIHSSKPAISFTLTVHPTDTISAIKENFADNESRAPPANVQRLLLKGKVLADNKLLQEYDDIKEGVVLNLMVKPGTTWNAEERDPSSKLRDNLPPQLHAPKPNRFSHTRSLSGAADQFPVPALTLSEPPSPTHAASPTGLKLGIPLDFIDMSIPSRPPSPRPMSATESFSEIISSVPFWRHLKEFLDKEFNGEVRDGDAAFEMFFLASKASLTPHEIAKIRDVVGVTGMGGA